MKVRALAALAVLTALYTPFAQSATSFRYFYDDANELYRVLDSTGTLIEYTYDPAGNITKVSRSTVPPAQLSVLNVTPASSVGGDTLTILGQNFAPNIAGNTVTIGGATVTIISASTTQLVVTAPTGTNGGAVSVTAGGVTATWSNTISVVQVPFITSVTPSSGAKGATLTVAVAGTDLFGATFALKAVDPIGVPSPATITVGSNTGTLANLNLVLGSTEGQFALIGTNAIGPGAFSPGSLFQIGPATNSASFVSSVLNTRFDPSVNPPLNGGQNTATAFASVLNTALDPAVTPLFPPGRNSASFHASVLNATFDPITSPPLAAGQNSASFFASVLNTAFNPATNPLLAAGQNTASSHISVLNTNAAGITSTIRTAAAVGVSVCNTASGCAATAPAVVTTNAAPAPRPAGPPRGSPSSGAVPVLEPLEGIASVTVGQTIRLSARNVDAGSAVEFDVNQAVIRTVGEPPYEALFTVPDGPGELVFQALVRAPGQPERLSPITRMTVLPDTGAEISGAVARGAGGVELALAAGGLRAEFFHLAQPVTTLPSLEGLQPVRSGYVTAINEPNPGSVFGDDPLGAHLHSDYAIRFSGGVRADEPGAYRFWLTTRSGAAVFIDGKPVANSGFISGQPAETPFSVALERGWHALEVVYYLAVGASGIRLDWQPPSGRREALGPEYLRTVLEGMTTVSAADGRFAFQQVPAKFDTVWIRVMRGDGFIEFPPVKPGARQVSIAVPE